MQETYSLAELLASLHDSQRRAQLQSLTEAQAKELLWDWRFWARPDQILPDDDWDGWLILAGRGWGKTRTGAETIRDEVEAGRSKRIGLVGETSADGRDVMVHGESGIIAVSPEWNRPVFSGSGGGGRPKLTWPNGAIATLYDAREPDQLRGPQHDFLWFDELAKYRYAEAVFDQAMFGLRLGARPRWLATTTPRPIALVKRLLIQPGVKVTRGRSDDNLRNISPSYRRNVIDRYKGTRLGRQELDAEILEDVPGALWTRRGLDAGRVTVDMVPALARLVIAIDPAITSGDSANETGVIAAGVDERQHGYTLEDGSLRGSPDDWARRAVALYRKYEADAMIAEANQGGEMVERVLRSVDPNIPVRLVRATRGKYVRAEPVAALYEQERISHVGTFPELEDQMIAFTPETAALRLPGESPDRVDALVWAYTDLFQEMTLPTRVERDYEDERRYERNVERDAETGY